MYQIVYCRQGQAHLFTVNSEEDAADWMRDLIGLAMVSWVVIFRKYFTHREVIAIEDKTGKCPWGKLRSSAP